MPCTQKGEGAAKRTHLQGLTVAYRSASRLYVSAVNFPVVTTFLGGGRAVRDRFGGEGAGLTRAVATENVFPSSPNADAESMATTSHFSTVPTSSVPGVYTRPLPTCGAGEYGWVLGTWCRACPVESWPVQTTHLNPRLAAVAESVARLEARVRRKAILTLCARAMTSCARSTRGPVS